VDGSGRMLNRLAHSLREEDIRRSSEARRRRSANSVEQQSAEVPEAGRHLTVHSILATARRLLPRSA